MPITSELLFSIPENKVKTRLNVPIEASEVSIIIPVKNNQAGINRYLKSFFSTQDLDFYPMEIIIVDNNSSPRITISQEYQNHGLVKLYFCETPGAAAARNYGIRFSRGKWLLFNDSDCVPTASFLKGYLKAFNGSIAYAGGVKSYDNSLISKYYDSQELLIPPQVKGENGNYYPQFIITANALVWKESFIQTGGFNERFQFAGGEDLDLGIRLSGLGYLSYANSSEIQHDFNDGLWGFVKRFIRYGMSNRIIEEIWNVDMRPKDIYIAKYTKIFFALSRIQYLSLLAGYLFYNIKLKRKDR